MHLYLGTFLIAASTLALEVSLARLLSVVSWYHLAFFAVSTAMLGMTAGATAVYLRPAWFGPESLRSSLSKSCLAYAVSVPVCLVLLCLTPIGVALETRRVAMEFSALLATTLWCALPFFFSGVAVSAVLARAPLPIGRLYFFDLLGASSGCLLALWGLSWLSAPGFILSCAVLGALAALTFAAGESRATRRAGIAVAVSSALVLLHMISPFGVRPVVVKGRIEDPSRVLIERWNSMSRVTVFEQTLRPGQQWAGSAKTPRNRSVQHRVSIDGLAETTMRRFHRTRDLEHLRYDLANVVYHLRPSGGAAIIGVGGGRDVQSALLFGHERVVGIEVNPIFVELAENRFRDFLRIAGRPEVELVRDEARSHLSRSSERFAVVQMSLVDTWAATGAGAFSLSENALYTLEGWQVFLDRLEPDGILTVSRWYSPEQVAEAGRMLSLGVAALLESGAEEPGAHLAMLTHRAVAALLVSRSPFSADDLQRLRDVARELGFGIAVLPGKRIADPVLRSIAGARSRRDLEARVADLPLDYTPPTDQKPYFFNMLRLQHLGAVIGQEDFWVLRGNLQATLTLLGLIGVLLVVALATVVLPIRWLAPRGLGATRAPRPHAPAIAYFCLIGAGFMSVEIALLQRLSIFLGHPSYSLGILLFGIILSTGVGSALSERLSLRRRAPLLGLPALAAVAVLVESAVADWLLATQIHEPTALKVAFSVAAIAPLGLVLGFFFPVGMRLCARLESAESPWYWALNGVFGVLFSATSVLVSIYVGVSANFWIGAACYAALLPCMPRLGAAREPGALV